MKKLELVNQSLYKKASEFCSKQDLTALSQLFSDNPEFPVGENLKGFGWSLLHTAAYFDFYTGIEFLIEKGIEIDVKEKSGSTALLFAVSNNSFAASQKLLRHGACVDAPNSKGLTPCMSACFNGNVDIFNLLLNVNPNLELKDARGLKAIDYANEKNNHSMKSIIEKLKIESFIKLTEKNTKVHKI